jgi:hypothetical protein
MGSTYGAIRFDRNGFGMPAPVYRELPALRLD